MQKIYGYTVILLYIKSHEFPAIPMKSTCSLVPGHGKPWQRHQESQGDDQGGLDVELS